MSQLKFILLKNKFLALSIALSLLGCFIVDVSFTDYIKLNLVFICSNIILALGLNLICGYTGQFSLGHAGFMAVGAYVSAYLSLHFMPFGTGALQILNFPILAILGGLAAAAAGYLVGLPSLRLKGDYLAIVTLGFSEIIRIVILNTEAVGAARGMSEIVQPQGFMSGYALSMFHAMIWVCLAYVIIRRLGRSSHGLAFMSVREDELAGEVMGIRTTKVKVQAFVIGSFFAGVAGSLFAHGSQYLNPSNFAFLKSVDVIIMIVLGGLGSLSGSVMAAIVVTILPEALRSLQDITGKDLRMVIFSLVLILLMILRPQGIMGDKEITFEWLKRKFKRG